VRQNALAVFTAQAIAQPFDIYARTVRAYFVVMGFVAVSFIVTPVICLAAYNHALPVIIALIMGFILAVRITLALVVAALAYNYALF